MTLSPPAVLLGSQEPRLRNAPPSTSSAVDEAVDLAASAGLVLDPWQRLSLEIMLGETPSGMWSAFEVALLVARQNGKGGILEARELWGLFLGGERLLLHSAHEFKTAKEAYLRIKGLIEGAPHLFALVKRRGDRVVGFRQSNEDTSIELQNGARLRFMARSGSTGRGFSAQTLLVDEAQILPAATMDALMPTLSAMPNPQIIYTGTVPRPEDNGEHFTSLRDRGRAGDDPQLAWLEWSIGEDHQDLDDRAAWSAANPALGYRLTEAFTEKERASLTDDGFARERLSLWSSRKGRTVIDMDRWASLADPKPPKVTEVGLALDVTPDRSTGSVAFAGRRPDGRRHIEIVRNAPGTAWMVDLVVQLRSEKPDAIVMVDATGPAGSLIDDLETAGIGVVVASARDMAQACGSFYDAATAEVATITHFDQPVLNVALGAARWRSLGDARAWHRKDATADISPLVAGTLALAASARHLLQPNETKKRPGRYW